MTLTPTEEYYQEGYELAYNNAKSLSKIASISADENEYGIACSLSILSAEESIKAVFLLLKQFNVQIELDDFDKVFRDHKTKHTYYPETSSVFQTIVEIFYTEGGLFHYTLDMVERLLPEMEVEQFLKEHKIFLDFLVKLNLVPDSIQNRRKGIDIEEEKIWWGNANLEKNRGLYVDKIAMTWHSPKSFTKEKYADVQNHTRYIIDNVEKIVNLLSHAAKKKTV